MESIKGFSLVNWIFVILGLICAFICPAFIQLIWLDLVCG